MKHNKHVDEAPCLICSKCYQCITCGDCDRYGCGCEVEKKGDYIG